MSRHFNIMIIMATAAAAFAGPPDASWGADRLAATVNGKDTAVAVEAAKAMGGMRDSAVAYAALTAAATNKKLVPDVRAAAIKALVVYGNAAAADEIIRGALGDPDVNAYAADALVAFKSADVGSKVAAVATADKEPARRAAAAELLGRLRPAVAYDTLVTAAADKNAEVRVATVRAFGRLGDDRAVEPLVKALDDKDWRVRHGACVALAGFKAGSSVKPLCECLEDGRGEVRCAAAATLAAIGDERALEPLRERFKEDNDADAKQAMAKAIDDMKMSFLKGIKP
jgi:HEAT repeat protein